MKKIIILFVIIIVSLCAYLSIYYFSVNDVSNVKLSGYVYDNNNKTPLKNVLIIINNERYEDDKGNKNYDEYLGNDKIRIYSNDQGYYSTIIKKSAFVRLSFQKDGYVFKTEDGQYSSKKMEYETYLMPN